MLFGLPLTETNTVTAALGIERNSIDVFPGITPQPIIDYINSLGKRTFNSWRLSAGWSSDSRNKFFAPTRGSYQRIGAEIALPGSTQEYYKIVYQYARYWPINDFLTLLTAGDIGFGDGYGNAEVLPFYENFYAGGPRSVRGFEDNTLGPCIEQTLIQGPCQPVGGALRTIGSVELIFPTPFTKRGEDSTQFSAFIDVGNVYEDIDSFEARELRASAGLAFKWQAPVGPIVINIAYPLIDEGTDRTETLQFTFGSAF
jgi:outer membrane protein insertion porin family